MEAAELEQRKQLARALLTSEAEGLRLGAASAAPVEAPLPEADVLVITWTAAEADALADVLTPGFERRRWRWYRRRFDEHYEALIRPGAPARMAGRLGSWLRTEIGGQSVICFKSELHLNQDGVATGEGTATLPVKDLLLQLIAEASPAVVLTIGTAGGVAAEQDLGDAIVTRAAKFRCRDEFRNEPFNGRTYRSDWEIPTRRFTTARELMQGFAPELVEPAFAPPTKRYRFEGPPLVSSPPNRPDIELDGDDFPAFHPILTTDFFEFGTSANRLDAEGCGVEMGDAVLGLACSELEDPPRWAVVRNVSDPVINADLPTHADITRNMQAVWAVWFYEAYGYWTSVTGALAAWGIIAGLSSHEYQARPRTGGRPEHPRKWCRPPAPPYGEVAAGSETPRAPEQRAAAQLREGFRERLGETIDTTGKLIAALASLGILFFATGYFVEWQRLKRGELPPEEILPLIPQEQIPAAGVRELVVSLVFVMLLLAAFGFARSRLAASSRVGRVRPGHVSRWDLALPALIVGLVTFLFAPLHADGIVVSLTLGGLTYYSFRLLYGYLAAVARARKAPPTADSGREDASPKFPLLRLTIAIFVAAIILSGARQREFPNPRAKVTVVLNTEAKIHGVFLGINADKVLVRVQRPPLGPRLIVLRSSEVKQIRIRKGAEFLTGGAPDSAFDETIGRLFDARFTCIPPECWAGYDTRVGPSSFF